MEAEKMICYWATCGKPVPARPGLRRPFVRCSECGHISCLHCEAMHEGKSCAAFQAERRPAAQSPYSSFINLSLSRSPSPLGAQRKNYDAPSPSKGARSSEGDMPPSRVSPRATNAANFDAMTLQTPHGLSWADASASTSSAGPSHSRNVTAQSTSPSKQSVVADRVTRSGDPGTSRQVRTAICRTEDCGFEKQVDASDTELYCYKCRKTTCLVCNASHGYITCEEYRRQLDDQEEEIQVWCAGKDCPFTVYVGASTQQLKCALCDRITCLKCQAVHEFQTCDAYARNRRQSNVPRPEGRTTGGDGETYAKEESTVEGSRADESESRDVAPPCATSAKEPIGREASRQKEVLVRHAANNPRPSETASERPQPRARQNATVAAPRVTVSERPQPRARHTASVAAPRVDVVMVECCTCAVESNIEEIIDVLGCGHLLCRECVHATAVGSLTYIVRCPVATEEGVSCDSYIQESALKSVMTEEEYALRNELLNSPIIRCPMEGCSGKFSIRPGTQRLNCPKCQIEYCASCSSNHSGITCDQFIRGVADDVDRPGVADNQSSGHSTSPLPETTATSDEESVECDGCLADAQREEVITVEQCGHLICRECIRRNTIEMTGNAARCPVTLYDGNQCNSPLQDSALQPPQATT